MRLATNAQNLPVAIERFTARHLNLPPCLSHLVEQNRITITGSAIAHGWRSYLIAPSKLSDIIRRGARVMWRDKEIAERDADAAMIWTLFEAGMLLEARVSEHRIKYPSELIGDFKSGQVWLLPFRDYSVVTTNEKDVDAYSRTQQSATKTS